MTVPQEVPFGEWLPDLPAHNNPGALIALNVIPQLKSYRSLNSLASFSNALTGACLGTFWAPAANGDIFNFAGDTSALYNLVSGTTWTDISGVSAPYTASNWEFTKFGETILAVNDDDPMQKYEMNVDAVFSDQPGTPPDAAHIATVRDFVMIGDIPSQGPNFVRWSGYNNSEIWDPSIRTQSDFQELFGRGGRVQRIVPGDYAVIFTEQSIWRADYVGPPVIFQFDEVDQKRGTPAPNSVIWQGSHVWYWGWDNFYYFNGRESKPISNNKVSRWFQLNASSDAWDSMRGALDRLNRLVIWAFRTNAANSINNNLIIYNWAANKWSYAVIDTQVIDEYVSPGFTLDDLDGPLPGGIDADSILVDSSQFQGGGINIQAFNASNEAATFDGTPLQATIDTKELSSPTQQRMMVNSLRPMIEATGSTTINMQVGTRDQLTENPSFTMQQGQNGINGEVNVRVNSRYQRYRCIIDGGFDHANGVKANVRQAGRR
jgi:hypothetical protein